MKDFKRRTVGLSVACTVLLVVAGLLGCSDDKGTEPPPPDKKLADSLVAVASDSLGRMLDEIINETMENMDSTFRPHDIDFSEVLEIFEDALEADPGHDSALFGAAFCGLMSILADPTLNDLYERIKNMIDTGGAFPGGYVPMVIIDRASELPGMPLYPGALPKALVDLTPLDPGLAKVAASDPTVGEVQDFLATVLLPRIITAQSRLRDVIGNPNFEFAISPDMQGNPGANPIIVDHADFLVMLAALHASEAVIHVFVARNLDLPNYTIEGVEEALARTSAFLSLKGGGEGAGHMSSAKTDILSAEEYVEKAITSLLGELSGGEDQTDDLIKVYPDDRADLEMALDTLRHYRDFFNGPRQLKVEWYTGDSCVDDGVHFYCYPMYDTLELTVDIAKLFDKPIVNPKHFLPDYSLTLGPNDDYERFVADHFSREAYWDSLLSIYGVSHPNDTAQFLRQYGFTGEHLPDVDNEEFYRLLASWNQTVFGWDDLSSWYTGMYLYYYESWHQYEYFGFYQERDYWVLCYEWADATYESWTWPDPTMNGLFPGMTSDRIKTEILTDVSAENWERSGCSNIGF